MFLQGTRDLNPQPSALEADALPIELVPFAARSSVFGHAEHLRFGR